MFCHYLKKYLICYLSFTKMNIGCFIVSLLFLDVYFAVEQETIIKWEKFKKNNKKTYWGAEDRKRYE